MKDNQNRTLRFTSDEVITAMEKQFNLDLKGWKVVNFVISGHKTDVVNKVLDIDFIN